MTHEHLTEYYGLPLNRIMPEDNFDGDSRGEEQEIKPTKELAGKPGSLKNKLLDIAIPGVVSWDVAAGSERQRAEEEKVKAEIIAGLVSQGHNEQLAEKIANSYVKEQKELEDIGRSPKDATYTHSTSEELNGAENKAPTKYLTREALYLVAKFREEGAVPSEVTEKFLDVMRDNGFSDKDIASKSPEELVEMLNDNAIKEDAVRVAERVVSGERGEVLAGNWERSVEKVFKKLGLSDEQLENLMHAMRDEGLIAEVRLAMKEEEATTAEHASEIMYEAYAAYLPGVPPEAGQKAWIEYWEVLDDDVKNQIDADDGSDIPDNPEDENKDEDDDEVITPSSGSGGTGGPRRPTATAGGSEPDDEEDPTDGIGDPDDHSLKNQIVLDWIARGIDPQVAMSLADQSLGPTDEVMAWVNLDVDVETAIEMVRRGLEPTEEIAEAIRAQDEREDQPEHPERRRRRNSRERGGRRRNVLHHETPEESAGAAAEDFDYDEDEEDEEREEKGKNYLRTALTRLGKAQSADELRIGAKVFIEKYINQWGDEVFDNESSITFREKWDELMDEEKGRLSQEKVNEYVSDKVEEWKAANAQLEADDPEKFEKELEKAIRRFNKDFIDPRDPDTPNPKKELQDILTTVFERFRLNAEREQLPKSMEDLVELLQKKLTEEYKEGGIRELGHYEEVTNNGITYKELKINYANLAGLMMKDAHFWANFSPDDPRVNLFGTPLLEMEYRQVNLGAVLYEGKQYMRKRIMTRKIGPDGQFMNVYEYVEDEDHKKFRNKMMNFVFYYQLTRNWNIYHGQTKEDMESLVKAMGEVLNTNGLTRTDGFQSLFAMPGLSEGDMLDDENTRIGELTAVAEKMYKGIYNFETLQGFLGRDAILFKKQFMEVNDEGQIQWEEGKAEPKLKDGSGKTTVRGTKSEWTTEWYDENGVLKRLELTDETFEMLRGLDEADKPNWDKKKDKEIFTKETREKLARGEALTEKERNLEIIRNDWVKAQFLDFINPWDEQNKDTKVKDQTRERYRQSLMQLAFNRLLLEDGELDPEQKAYKDLLPRVQNMVNRRIKKKEIKLETEDGVVINPEDQEQVKLFTDRHVRDEMRKAIMQYSYEDARMAEEIAYTFGWMGLRGMGDTSLTGYYADTKMYRTKDYREGSSRNKGQDIGNPRTIAIYKAIAAPIYAAVLTTDGDSIQEKIDKIADDFIHHGGTKTADLAKEFVFKEDSLKTYWGNHFNRDLKRYNSLAEASEWNLSKMITWDPVKGVVIDRAAIYKQFDDEWVKPERYALSGYTDLDFTKQFESFTVVTGRGSRTITDENGIKRTFRVVQPKSEPMATFMLGEQVFERDYMKMREKRDSSGNVIMQKKRDEHGKVEKDEDGNPIMVPVMEKTDEIDLEKVNDRERSRFHMEPILLRIAADIKSHRDSKDMSAYWDNHTVNMFFHALEKIPASVTTNERNIMNITVGAMAFSHAEIAYIRRLAGVESWKLMASDIGFAMGGALISGTIAGAKKVVGAK